MHNIKNTSDFIELLEIEYPEKALALLGMDFHAHILYTYLTVNALDEHSFNPIKFKNYLKNPFINIPYYNLLNNYSHYLIKKKRYYLYCEEGKQSLEISKRLNAFGYDTLSITGGFISFK